MMALPGRERGILEKGPKLVDHYIADAKQHHGHRYARFRGLQKVQIQCLLAEIVQNINMIALLIAMLCCFYLWRANLSIQAK